MALRYLLGSSNGNDIDAGFLALATDVENSVTGYKSGTNAARLAAANYDGLLWRETDTGRCYLGNGTTWIDLGVPGAWQALTLATNIVAVGTMTPSARLEGDRVRLKGQIQNNTGSTQTGTALATIPAGFRPPTQLIFGSGVGSAGGGATIVITSGGAIQVGWVGLPNLDWIGLDGITYTLS